jgi:hypothetical protein
VIGSLAQALGGHLILGINLEADSPGLAAAEARAELAAIGRGRVDALELGNEPELYGTRGWYRNGQGAGVPGRPAAYGFDAFARDFARMQAALPDVSLAGPATGTNTWSVPLGKLLTAQPRLRVVTVHRYPLQACFFPTATPVYPTVADLLSQHASRGLADSVAPYLAAAHRRGVRLRLDEMNAIACGVVPHLSNTFALALWALDALFADAAHGVDGVNIHTYPGFGSQLFTFRHVGSRWQATVEPEYYGLLMFARAAPVGSRLVPVSGSNDGLRAWATQAPDGKLRIVLINDRPRRAVTVTVQIPGMPQAASLERLLAPSVDATGGTTLDGQGFGAVTTTGRLAGAAMITRLTPTPRGLVIQLPAGSAALLTVH